MTSNATTPELYIEQIPEERKPYFMRLRQTILDNLPAGFEETIIYGMIGYVVPKSIYPAGYHCDPALPLSFISIASQKNYISLYHSGIYADPELMAWFVEAYPHHVKGKLDMGKSCIRMKKPEHIPFELIGELCRKMTVQQWIDRYEAVLKGSG